MEKKLNENFLLMMLYFDTYAIEGIADNKEKYNLTFFKFFDDYNKYHKSFEFKKLKRSMIYYEDNVPFCYQKSKFSEIMKEHSIRLMGNPDYRKLVIKYNFDQEFKKQHIKNVKKILETKGLDFWSNHDI